MSAERRPAAAVVVRRAEQSDLREVAEIERRSFSDPWTLAAFAGALVRPDTRFSVAERPGVPGGPVVGYLVAWFVGDEGEIGNVAVDAAHRGQGIGAALLDDVLEAAARSGVRSVFLEVRESNAAARALYESRGFAPVGRRRRYYRAPVEDALVLQRTLGGGD